MNISSSLLVVWYCMSIIGFDVHTCTSSGRTFVATFAASTACADIHPEHHCCNASCCCGHHHHEKSCCSSEHGEDMPAEHSGGETVGAKSCCSNEYQVIQISGCRTDLDSDENISFCEVFYTCLIDNPLSYMVSAGYHAEHIQFIESGSGVLLPGDLCATFGVWRI